MITVENDYETIIYEQPFSSLIYENQLEVGPIDNNPQITQEVNEINTVIKHDKKRRSTMLEHKSYLSKQTKRTTKRENFDNSNSFREPENQRISTTRS